VKNPSTIPVSPNIPLRTNLECKWYLFAALFCALLSALLIDPSLIGRRDLIAYWSAFRLLVAEGNPYSPSELQSVQSLIPGSADLYMPFRSPPWALMLLSPILSLPWVLCCKVFFGVSVFGVALMISGIARARFVVPSTREFYLIFALHQPIIACLYWGQVGIIQALAGGYLLKRSRTGLLSSFALAILACKPHPYYLFLFVWLLINGFKKEWRTIAGGAAIIGSLAACSILINPKIFDYWFTGFAALQPFALIKPTIIDWVRLLALNGRFGPELSIAVPLLTLLSAFFLRKKILCFPDRAIALCIPISLLTAPYAWHHDFVAIYFTLAICLCGARGRIGLLGLGVLELLAAALGSPPHLYIFIPLLALVFALAFSNSLAKAD